MSANSFLTNDSVCNAAQNDILYKLQEKDDTLRTVAHDLRNPLGGISSLTDLLIEQPQDSENLEMLLAIKEAATHSLKLVQEILLSSDQSIEQRSKTYSLHQIIKNCARLFSKRFAEKNLQFKLNLFEGASDLAIDSEKITRVIDNLISNAIKFSKPNGSISVNTEKMKEGIHMMVRDNGIGIPDFMKDKVFNGSTEIRRAGTAGEASHGLGLSICRRIIENYGGNITFQSKLGKGTIFHIWLPGILCNNNEFSV